MFSKIHKRMKGEKGFTLIELLVVIIIIAILAAIAIPTFLGQRQKAYDAAAKSLVRNAMTSMESYYVDTRDFTGATNTLLQAIEPTITFTSQAATAATTATASAAANTVNFTVTAGSPDLYQIGTVSKSGTIWGVVVNKGTGGGVTWDKTSGGTTTAGW
jgi:type IV pilus assembly protein PilA